MKEVDGLYTIPLNSILQREEQTDINNHFSKYESESQAPARSSTSWEEAQQMIIEFVAIVRK